MRAISKVPWAQRGAEILTSKGEEALGPIRNVKDGYDHLLWTVQTPEGRQAFADAFAQAKSEWEAEHGPWVG